VYADLKVGGDIQITTTATLRNAEASIRNKKE